MDPLAASLIESLVSDAIKIIGPAAITGYIAYRSTRAQYDIEKLRLHDSDRTEAYKRLLVFARGLRNRVFPLATDKEDAFRRFMQHEYVGAVDKDSVYFRKDIVSILDRLESEYICMTDPDLIPEFTEVERQRFLEDELFSILEQLVDKIREVMQSSGVSA